MAIKISGKGKSVTITKGKVNKATVAPDQEVEMDTQAPEVTSSGKIKTKVKKVVAGADSSAGATKSFLKKGMDAMKALEKEEEKAEQESELRLKVRSFWMKPESTTTITFLDGDLHPEHQMLDIGLVYNHNVYHAGMGAKGERIDVVCVRDEEPCPLCEHDKSALVGVMSIVEHIEYEDQSGNLVSNPRRLFMPKRTTLKELQEAATELGGLRGAQFRVRRTSKRKATVGDEFEFVGRLSEEQMAAAFVDTTPLNYEDTLVYLSGDAMYECGLIEGVKKGLSQPSDAYGSHGGHGNGNGSAYAGAASDSMMPRKSGLPQSLDDEL